MASKIFGVQPQYDQKWYTFGPFNPAQGEKVDFLEGYVFKVIIEGVTGDDGNLYRCHLSYAGNSNKSIEGANVFIYEYTFRLHDKPGSISHIYPAIDDRVISVKQSNFDYDNDGLIRIVSVAKRGLLARFSSESDWKTSTHPIVKEEHGTSLDIQFIKGRNPAKNNNMVFYATNQYGEFLPFYVIPIGGVPRPVTAIQVKKKGNKN